jgi:hypothetical protein
MIVKGRFSNEHAGEESFPRKPHRCRRKMLGIADKIKEICSDSNKDKNK